MRGEAAEALWQQTSLRRGARQHETASLGSRRESEPWVKRVRENWGANSTTAHPKLDAVRQVPKKLPKDVSWELGGLGQREAEGARSGAVLKYLKQVTAFGACSNNLKNSKTCRTASSYLVGVAATGDEVRTGHSHWDEGREKDEVIPNREGIPVGDLGDHADDQ